MRSNTSSRYVVVWHLHDEVTREAVPQLNPLKFPDSARSCRPLHNEDARFEHGLQILCDLKSFWNCGTGKSYSLCGSCKRRGLGLDNVDDEDRHMGKTSHFLFLF